MELASLSQQAGSSLNMTPPQQPDPIMDNIRIINTHSSITIANILQQMRDNEEQFYKSFDRQQEFESIQNDPEQLRHCQQQVPHFGTLLQHNLAIVKSELQRNIQTMQSLLEQFEQAVTYNLTLLTGSKEQLVSQKIATWKHEQQRLANGINIPRSVSLHQLQLWCSELVNCTWELYKQLQDAGQILQHGTIPTGIASNQNVILEDRSQQNLKLLQELLNNSLVVEEQPQQIVKLRAKLTKSIVVSLLTGKCLNVHMAPPMITTSIITEEQARSLSVSSTADGVENMVEITNGNLGMEYKEETQRLSVTFTNLQLRRVLGKNEEQRQANDKRVMEKKVCIQFACTVTVGSQKINLSTSSFPIVMTSHGSQETLAAGTIWWDHAFGAMGRLPFDVPAAAPWSEVAEVLNAKFKQMTDRGLSQHNLEYLAKLAFRNQQPQPATITWNQLCKDPLPGESFTFFAWFHGALKLVEKRETQLKELWKEGLIVGFTDRQYAEHLLSTYSPGTFLFRFANRYAFGALSIVCCVGTDPPKSMHPFQSLDLQAHKLPLRLKEIEILTNLVKQTFECVPKDEAFGPFYNKENIKVQVSTGPNKPPYDKILHTIPVANISTASSKTSGGTMTVAPPQGISHRSSLQEVIKFPGAGQQTCGPKNHPALQLSHSFPSPRTTQPFQNVQNVGGPTSSASISMSTSMETDSNTGVAYSRSDDMGNVPQYPNSPLPSFSQEFGTPPPLLPISEPPGANQSSYDYEATFDDLIRVIHTDVDMDEEEEDLTHL